MLRGVDQTCPSKGYSISRYVRRPGQLSTQTKKLSIATGEASASLVGDIYDAPESYSLYSYQLLS